MHRRFGNKLVLDAKQMDKGRYCLIISNTNLPLFAKFQGVIMKALQGEGYIPVVINADRHKVAEQYYKLFGARHYIKWSNFIRTEVNPLQNISQIVVIIGTQG